MTIQQRHEREAAFFKTSPWITLSKKHLGIHNLRESLSRLLGAHIAQEFPAIETEIEAIYSKATKEREAVGDARQTSQEHGRFLIKLAVDYQTEVSNALEGRYSEELMHASKLRMHVQNAADHFNGLMHKNGATLQFKNVTDEVVAPNLFAVQKQTGPKDIYREIQELWRMFRGPELPGKALEVDALALRPLTNVRVGQSRCPGETFYATDS